MTRAQLKAKAKENLIGNWAIAIFTVILTDILISIPILYCGQPKLDEFKITISVISILINGVITLGLNRFLLDLATKNKEAKVSTLFSQFNIYFKALGLSLLYYLVILVGILFFIIPGIVFYFMFSQAYFILAEDTSKSIIQCMSESATLMRGHKVDLFVLELSFVGWEVLSIITFGIVGIWVEPYRKVTLANFYLDIKKI